MDVLWEKRQRGSDLVGTVINIHNGDWVRRGKALHWHICCCHFIHTVKHGHLNTSNPIMTLIETIFTSVPSLLLMTDSGVGAGIDSYYEYLMKAYILLGDKVYLERFNTVRTLYSSEIIKPLLVKQSLFYYIHYLHM